MNLNCERKIASKIALKILGFTSQNFFDVSRLS